MINFICNFMYLFDTLFDWIFDIPDLYKDCIFDAQTCKDLDKELIHSFDKTVYAPSVINVTCTPEKRFDGLPDWDVSLKISGLKMEKQCNDKCGYELFPNFEIFSSLQGHFIGEN